MFHSAHTTATAPTCDVNLARGRADGLSRRRGPAKRGAEPVPGVDRGDGRGEVDQLLFGEFRIGLTVDLVAHTIRQQGQGLRPGQRRALARRELRRLPPNYHEVELVSGDTKAFALQDVILHAE